MQVDQREKAGMMSVTSSFLVKVLMKESCRNFFQNTMTGLLFLHLCFPVKEFHETTLHQAIHEVGFGFTEYCKTKVIIQANHNRRKQHIAPSRKRQQRHANEVKSRKVYVNQAQLVLFYF